MENAPSQSPSTTALATRLSLIAALGVAAALILFIGPPLPQSQSYHHFADERSFLGIPNFANVVSNVPFVVVGILGLAFLWGWLPVQPAQSFSTRQERWAYLLLFIAVFFTGFGSAYYHLRPDNERLVWDRLPMAVAFMALFASVIGERVNVRIGLLLLPVLVALGIASVIYWHWSEIRGRGDQRFYYLVQFYPMAAMPCLLLLMPARYTRTGDFFVAVGWYALAKVFEHHLDGALLSLGDLISGHTLKHLLAAVSVYWILRMLIRRRPCWAKSNEESGTVERIPSELPYAKRITS
jgi:hypothetical protein